MIPFLYNLFWVDKSEGTSFESKNMTIWKTPIYFKVGSDSLKITLRMILNMPLNRKKFDLKNWCFPYFHFFYCRMDELLSISNINVENVDPVLREPLLITRELFSSNWILILINSFLMLTNIYK